MIVLVTAGKVVPTSLVVSVSYFVLIDDFVFVGPLGPMTLLRPQLLGFRKLVLPCDQYRHHELMRCPDQFWDTKARSSSRPMLAS